MAHGEHLTLIWISNAHQPEHQATCASPVFVSGIGDALRLRQAFPKVNNYGEGMT
jgi:hypothetical protein